MVPTGQGKLENVKEFVLSGKCQGKILFWKSQGKVRENDLGSCRLQITVIFASPNINKKFELMLTRRVKAYSSSGSVV